MKQTDDVVEIDHGEPFLIGWIDPMQKGFPLYGTSAYSK
jgi:hypothetical protein